MRDWPLPSARCSVPRRLHHGQNAASGRPQSRCARSPLVAPQTFSEEALGISQPRGHLGRLTNHERGEPTAAYGARAERALAAACSLCFVRFLLLSARLQTAQFTARRDSADGARSSHCRWPPACPPDADPARGRPSEQPAGAAAVPGSARERERFCEPMPSRRPPGAAMRSPRPFAATLRLVSGGAWPSRATGAQGARVRDAVRPRSGGL